MRISAIAVASIAMAALSACGQKDAASTTTVENTTATTVQNDAGPLAPALSDGQAFANAAAASDAFEIETSKLALTTSKSLSIKRFAQKMVDAHTESTAKLKAAASGASPAVVPDPTMTSEQSVKLENLKSLSGMAFDNAYIATQAEGHQKALDTLRSYSASGNVPELKSFAATLAPTVTAHLNMAKSLKA